MTPKIEPSRPKTFRRSIWLGAGGILTVLAIEFGLEYAIDFVANPWAYGLMGGATPVGTWIGSGTLNDGRKYGIKLVMEHSLAPVTEGFLRPDLTGESTACTPGLPQGAKDLRGDVGWTGKSVTLTTAFALNGVQPETSCTLTGDSLACTLFYANKRSEEMTKALKKIGKEVTPRTVQVTFTRLREGASAPDLCKL